MFKSKFVLSIILLLLMVYLSCKDNQSDTPTQGVIEVFTDENIFPIVEEEKQVFEVHYPNATINLKFFSDKEISKKINEGKTKVFVLSRELNKNEKLYFSTNELSEKVYPFAYSAIAFITNKNSFISKLSELDIQNAFKGIGDLNLVIDNSNSSSLLYFTQKYGIKKLSKNISALSSNKEVIDYVSKNKDFIGVVDLNWISYTDEIIGKMLEQVKILPMLNKNNVLVKPEQVTIADTSYPFIRTLYLYSFQGKIGLGVGFGAFMTSDIGQRIILKSGIQPYNMPSREIQLKK